MNGTKTMPIIKARFPNGYAETKQKTRNFSMKITPEQGLYIRYRLRVAGATMKTIADEVGCTRQTVYTVLSGRNHSKKIEAAVAHRLSYSTWNDMVSELRKGGGERTHKNQDKGVAQ